MEVKQYTKDQLDNVLRFEQNLRKEEDFWSWEIDDTYLQKVKNSFDDDGFRNSLSLPDSF